MYGLVSDIYRIKQRKCRTEYVNSPLSLAIAVATFPEQPLIALALVIGPLIKLPVLSIVSGILLRWNKENA